MMTVILLILAAICFYKAAMQWQFATQSRRADGRIPFGYERTLHKRAMVCWLIAGICLAIVA